MLALLERLCSNGLNPAINNGILSFNFNGLNLKFGLNCSARSLNDVYAIGEYNYPEILSNLKGKDVVDIGANVGDSPIYFAVLGAKKVIGVEPLPNVANCAINNVKLNNLENKIKIINAGLVPVVYKDGGGWTDIVSRIDEGLGYKNIEEAALIIKKLLSENGRLNNLSEKAKDIAKNFSYEKFKERLNEVIEELINNLKGITG